MSENEPFRWASNPVSSEPLDGPLDAILPGVREVLDAQSATSTKSEMGLCATFTVSGQPEAWVQFNIPFLNFAYPWSIEPLIHLEGVLSSLESWQLVDWEAGTYATVNIGAPPALAVARAIEAIFRALGAVDTYAVEVSMEDLDGDE